MEKREELESLFEYRDKIVKDASNRIFHKIRNVLGGIDVFLSQNDTAYANGSISWEDVQYMEDNNIIVVFGVLSFVPGATFDIGGKVIEITEDNVGSFDRMVRIGIPINLASEGTQEEIVKFLGGIEQRNESFDENNVRNVASELPTLLKKKDHGKNQDFDWDKLTEEQRKALFLNDVSQKPS